MRVESGASKRALSLIRGFEGCVLVPVADADGDWSVGFGHTVNSGGQRITQRDADLWLCEDADTAAREVDRLVAVPLAAGERDALVSLVFNVGATAFGASTLCKKLNAGDRVGAAREFDRWIYDGGAIVPGLVSRRKQERELFMSDKKSWFMDRLREPSTWRGLGGLLAAVGLVSAGSVDALLAVGMSLVSLVEVVRGERDA